MKNLEVIVSRETRMVNLPKQFIAVDGENLQSKLVFSFSDDFVNGQARLEYEINGEKKYIVLHKENENYTIPVKNVITKEGQIDMQLVITESSDEDEIPVFKSNKFYLYCNSSINAVKEAPDGYDLWIEQANAKLNKVDKVLDIIKTDGNGTKYLSDDGTYKFVQGGTGVGTITDVRVNGVSVVTNGVANIDSKTDAGISAELLNTLKTYFTNMQTLFTQLAYTTENHIGNTLVQNAKDVVTALEVKTEQPESGIVQTGNILAITSGVTATQTGSVLVIA